MISRNKLTLLLKAALFAALTAVCSQLAIPTSPPITLQLFSVTLSMYLLGPVFGFLSVLIYVSLGVIGLPVFSGFSGGIGHLLGATGGYILGFVLYALIFIILKKLFSDGTKREVVYSFVSLLLFYALGAVWYTFVYLDGDLSSLLSSVTVTVLPFVLPDIVKIVLAAVLAARIKRAVANAR